MRILIVFVLTVSYLTAWAQKKAKTITLSDTIIFATLDRAGELYVITKHGQIQKFDENDNLSKLYKSESIPTLFDPRDGVRIFAYYRNKQQYDYLNPSFEVVSSYRVDSAFVIRPWLICPSGEYKLWILDAEDNSLKRIHTRTSEVEIEVTIDHNQIDDVTTFSFMREYQGFIFLHNPAKGIYVFNSLGNPIKKIEVSTPYFNFIGEELYYIKNNELHLFDLFSAQTRKIALPRAGNTVLITDTKLYAISPNTIEIMNFKP